MQDFVLSFIVMFRNLQHRNSIKPNAKLPTKVL